MSKLSDWIEANKDDPDCESTVRNYTMNKALYEREYAEAEAKGEVVVCQHCGYPEMPERSLEGASFKKYQCCFHCWFWLHNHGLVNGPKPGAVIVGGVHYRDGGNRSGESSRFLGFGGSLQYYRRIGETEWTETNNLWHQGVIPKKLNIADTHEFKPYEPKNMPIEGEFNG
jgi:hypothetical protein